MAGLRLRVAASYRVADAAQVASSHAAGDSSVSRPRPSAPNARAVCPGYPRHLECVC